MKRGKNREKKLEKSVFLEKMIDSETRKKKFDEWISGLDQNLNFIFFKKKLKVVVVFVELKDSDHKNVYLTDIFCLVFDKTKQNYFGHHIILSFVFFWYSLLL